MGGLLPDGWQIDLEERDALLYPPLSVSMRNIVSAIRLSKSAIVVVGTIIQTSAINIGMIIAGRLIAGLPIGVLLSIVPVYNAELSLPKYRGIIVGLFAAMASFGVLCSNWVGYACFFATGNAQWRIPLGCQAPSAVILCVGGFFLPESPRWCMEFSLSPPLFNTA